jgi:hypothetical protein
MRPKSMLYHSSDRQGRLRKGDAETGCAAIAPNAAMIGCELNEAELLVYKLHLQEGVPGAEMRRSASFIGNA